MTDYDGVKTMGCLPGDSHDCAVAVRLIGGPNVFV